MNIAFQNPASVFVLCLSLVCSAVAQRVRAESPDTDRWHQVSAIMTKYCSECHATEDPSGGIFFKLSAKPGPTDEGSEAWIKALYALESQIMPPAEADQPSAEEVQLMIRWLEDDFSSILQKRNKDVRKAGLRRLNREEYNNTVRDLFGINIRPADDFPSDESAFGYDNNSAAQSLSTMHVEKYVAAAESVVEKAIVAPHAAQLEPTILYPKSANSARNAAALQLSANSPVNVATNTKGSGWYQVEVLLKLGSRQPPSKLTLSLGEQERTVHRLFDDDLEPIYQSWLYIPQKSSDDSLALGVRVPADASATGATRWELAEVNLIGPVAVDASAKTKFQSKLIDDQLQKAVADNDQAHLDEMVRGAINRFAETAFRRPLRAGENAQLFDAWKNAYDRGETLEGAMQQVLRFVLVSPHFLFMLEPTQSPSDIENEFALASRLSYFLWSSTPDEELLKAARDGSLRKQLRAQVKRMMDDPKIEAFCRNFSGQWLRTRRMDAVTPDLEQFAGFNDSLRAAMKKETELYFSHLVRNNRSLLELLDSNYSFLNEPLAKHYGIDDVKGDEFRQVKFDDNVRGGILTQASFLTLTSNPNRTSPVRRGQFILEQILGTPPPPPPPNVENLDDSREASAMASLRERMQQHRANPACASCHERMDPIGFALEHFDAVGRFRATDGEFPIDSSGKLTDGRTFNGVRDLKKLLASEPKQFGRTFVRNLMTYAYGRGLEMSDYPAVERVRQRLESDAYRIESAIVGIVESDEFQGR